MECDNCNEEIDPDAPCPSCGWWFCAHDRHIQIGPDSFVCADCGVDL